MGNVYLRFINSIYNFKNSKIFCSLFLQSALQFAATEPRELDNLYPDTLVAVLSLELAEGKQRAVNMAEVRDFVISFNYKYPPAVCNNTLSSSE